MQPGPEGCGAQFEAPGVSPLMNEWSKPMPNAFWGDSAGASHECFQRLGPPWIPMIAIRMGHWGRRANAGWSGPHPSAPCGVVDWRCRGLATLSAISWIVHASCR